MKTATEIKSKYIIQNGEKVGYIKLKQNKTGLYEVSLNLFGIAIPADFATFDNLENAEIAFDKFWNQYSY